jgi:hypothetical protein
VEVRAREQAVTLQASYGDRMIGTVRVTLQIRTRYPVYLPLVLRQIP